MLLLMLLVCVTNKIQAYKRSSVDNDYVGESTLMCSYQQGESTENCSYHQTDAHRNCGANTEGEYVELIDSTLEMLSFSEGNEENEKEERNDKARIYGTFDDCSRAGKFVKLLRFRNFARYMSFSKNDPIGQKKTFLTAWTY